MSKKNVLEKIKKAKKDNYAVLDLSNSGKACLNKIN